jgi:hypothetical protein
LGADVEKSQAAVRESGSNVVERETDAVALMQLCEIPVWF